MSDEKDFIYIKPEEVDKYKKLGYKIREGPRGGIRAYFPTLFGVGAHSNDNSKEKADYTDAILMIRRELDNIEKDFNVKERVFLNSLIRKADRDLANGDISIGLSHLALLMFKVPSLKKYAKYFWGSDEAFERWFKRNVVTVKKFWEAGLLVGRSNLVSSGDLTVSFKPLLRKSIITLVDTASIFSYAWYRNDDFLESFNKSVNRYRILMKDAFGEEGVKFFDEIIEEIKLASKMVIDILDNESIDVDSDKINEIMSKFDEFANSRVDKLRKRGFVHDADLVQVGFFSFENLFADLIDRAESYMDKYSARLVVMAMAFQKMGFSRKEAYSLAKGWEIARFWTGEEFKKFTHYIEKLIVECRGNHRPVRKKYGVIRDNHARIFFEKYVSCRDLENWRKFVQAFLRRKYGDKIKIYRGVRAREVGQAVIDFILDGEVRLGGVAESGTIDIDVAAEWGWSWWYFKTAIPIDYVIGCWLNASPYHVDDEWEITFEKPPGGLPGELVNADKPELNGIFSEAIFKDEKLMNEAIYLIDEGLESMERLYGEDSPVVRRYKLRALLAKSKLTEAFVKKKAGGG